MASPYAMVIHSRGEEASQLECLQGSCTPWAMDSVLLFIFGHDPVSIFNGSFNNLLDSLRVVFI